MRKIFFLHPRQTKTNNLGRFGKIFAVTRCDRDLLQRPRRLWIELTEFLLKLWRFFLRKNATQLENFLSARKNFIVFDEIHIFLSKLTSRTRSAVANFRFCDSTSRSNFCLGLSKQKWKRAVKSRFVSRFFRLWHRFPHFVQALSIMINCSI